MTGRIIIGLGAFVCLFAGAAQRDVFSNANQTRRPAQNDEFLSALDVRGCAGFLLGPNIGGSAAHCRMSGPIRSGIAMRDGLPADGQIGRTIEVGSVQDLDYWIFEIRWSSGQTPHGVQFVPLVQRSKDELKTGANEVADKLYTLGFPADISQGRLIYAYGYGKSDGSDNLITNNISLINGNSGGMITREMDDMLVSIVSGGPHAFGQPGWQGSSWNDPTHWNHGPAVWKVYARSNELRRIFPDGRNIYHSMRWQLEEVSPMGWVSAALN